MTIDDALGDFIIRPPSFVLRHPPGMNPAYYPVAETAKNVYNSAVSIPSLNRLSCGITMRARTFLYPYLLLLFTLLVLALLEWINITSASQPNPQQDQSSQVPSALEVVFWDGAVWANEVGDPATNDPCQLFPRERLLAGRTELPLTVYPLHLLLYRSG